MKTKKKKHTKSEESPKQKKKYPHKTQKYINKFRNIQNQAKRRAEEFPSRSSSSNINGSYMQHAAATSPASSSSRGQ